MTFDASEHFAAALADTGLLDEVIDITDIPADILEDFTLDDVTFIATQDSTPDRTQDTPSRARTSELPDIPAARDGFGAWFAQALAASGHDEHTLARLLGITPMAVIKWWTGDNRPATARLVELADALDVDLAALCEAADKPPVDALRASFGRNPQHSLPGMLRAWQTEQGFSASEAGQATGLTRNDWSRMVCGSAQPAKSRLRRLAAGTGIDLVVLADAAWPGHDEASREMREWARRYTAPTAQLVRAGLGGHRPTTIASTATGLSSYRLADLADGTDVPSVDECLALARGLHLDAGSLLLAAEVDDQLAARLAQAAHDARFFEGTDGRDLLLTERQRPYVDPAGLPRKAISWEELSRRTSMGRFRIMKVARGTHATGFTAIECLELADALSIEPAKLLAGFGHVA